MCSFQICMGFHRGDRIDFRCAVLCGLAGDMDPASHKMQVPRSVWDFIGEMGSILGVQFSDLFGISWGRGNRF